MFIHWFPGHMTKAIRMMEKEISLVNSVIYVLDARAPLSSINPSFDKVIGNKPRLYVLNKSDLVSKDQLAFFQKYFEKDGGICIIANSTGRADSGKVIKGLLDLNSSLIEKYAAKGIKKTVRAMVIGVPNSGKSTLINSLANEKKTVTGNKPGVTRGKQWINIDRYIELLDSPGVLYPDFENQEKATKLALLGSIKDDILDINELALEGIKMVYSLHPSDMTERYKLTGEEKEPLAILEKIALARGFLLRGGDVDYDRASKAFITDFRKGYLGKFSLDKVSD